jgi:hypothetical protein
LDVSFNLQLATSRSLNRINLIQLKTSRESNRLTVSGAQQTQR